MAIVMDRRIITYQYRPQRRLGQHWNELGRLELHEELSQSDLMTLLTRAEAFVCPDLSPWTIASIPSRSIPHFTALSWFYRNKPAEYFNDIMRNRSGIMEVYLKDYNGDQGCPINGRLRGLFFNASVYTHNGQIPNTSPFGPQRLYVSPMYILMRASNLFFADFYCKKDNGPHWITLVMTRPGSTADMFCRSKLLQLDLRHNVFLRFDGWSVFVNGNSYVEIFYTEDIDIRDALEFGHGFFAFTPSAGTSRASGIPKNLSCPFCNV